MKLKIPSNYFHKTDVKEIVKDGVIFQDGSYEKIDTIVYCTGMLKVFILFHVTY